MIKIELLRAYGGVTRFVKKGAVLFQEGDKAIFYYQIISGLVKMNNYNDDGQETIQRLFHTGESFGEPALLGNFAFPANAVIMEDTHLFCLEKQRFLQLLNEHTDVSLLLLKSLSNRLRFKAIVSKEVKGFNAKHRISALLKYMKEQAGVQDRYGVDITRQTIANLTGLRVETVIRTLKVLEREGKIAIENRKIYC
jgi:CRP-like cAMP-binding protein